MNNYYLPFICVIVAVVGLGFVVRWFLQRHAHAKQQVQTDNAQQQNHVARAQIAQQLMVELVENKNKCEAFMAIYTDLLQQLRNTDQRATYQDTGDFIHRFVPLNRQAYDSLTAEQISLLGVQWQTDLADIYHVFQAESVYDELSPQTDRGQAIHRIEAMIDDTQAIAYAIENAIQALAIVARS